jgi:hypothetical protein
MLPQGAVWQHLRQSALDTVRVGALVPFSSPSTLAEWFTTGAFSVQQVTGKQVLLHASTVDIGSALLSDASFHADHAVEHAVTLRNQLGGGKWTSPAWQAVTFYYWSYHAIVALSRILGRTVLFVSGPLASSLTTLATNGVRIGAGPYTLECGMDLSANQREVRLRRSNQTRAHDALWHLWFEGVRKLAGGFQKSKSTDAEARLYLAMLLGANALGNTWPSELRNLLNYTAGIAYGAVRKTTPSAVYGAIAVDPPATVQEVIDRFEANSSSLISGRPIQEQIGPATRVLIDLTFILDMLLTELLLEVSDRRNIDSRWLVARNSFRRLHARSFIERAWPCV